MALVKRAKLRNCGPKGIFNDESTDLTVALAYEHLMLMALQRKLQLHLSRAMLRQRLGHSILLVGESDDDKNDVALYFAKMLLCERSSVENEEIRPCDVCITCTQIALLRHANVEWLRSAPSEEIKIEQVREVKERLRLSSFDNKARLIVLPNANALTTQAANALLKSIEEPNVGQYFFLMATSSSALLKTLVSRCQRIVMQGSDDKSHLAATDISKYAKDLIVRIRSGDLHARAIFIEEVEKKEWEKTQLLLEVQSAIHDELRENAELTTKGERRHLLKSLEATESSRHLLEQNANTRLTLEQWLLNAWPLENP